MLTSLEDHLDYVVSIPDLFTELGTHASLEPDETFVSGCDLVFYNTYVAIGN